MNAFVFFAAVALCLQIEPALGAPCGNDLCKIDETPSNCPADCLGIEFRSTMQSDQSSRNGSVFRIRALRDVEVTSLYANTYLEGDGEVRVYTKHGTYADDSENMSTNGWTIIYWAHVNRLGRGTPTILENLLTRVIIKSGEYQSFYVVAEGGLWYTRGR